MPNIKNIIIFIAIGAVLVLAYVIFLKPKAEVSTLVSSTSITTTSAEKATSDEVDAKDFLALLLSVREIKLDYALFSDDAFIGLRDSSITLTQDGTEGRINPFAPLGTDIQTPANP